MADKKKIEIQIAATGGDKAAGELKKVADAATSAQTAVSQSASAPESILGPELEARLEALSDSAKKYKESLSELKEELSETSKEAKSTDESVSEIAKIAKAQAISNLASRAGDIGKGFKEAADRLQEFDQEGANSLRRIGDQIETVSGMVSRVAQGYAAGGPIGAALTSAGEFVSQLVGYFQEGSLEAARMAGSVRRAGEESADSFRKVAAAANERNLALSAAGNEGKIAKENALLKEQTEILREQRDLVREKRRLEQEILSANDRLKLSEIDQDESSKSISKEEAERRRGEVEFEAGGRKRQERKTVAIENARDAAARALAALGSSDRASRYASERESEALQEQKALDDLVAKTEAEMDKIKAGPGGGLASKDKIYVESMEAALKSQDMRVKALNKEALFALDAAKEAQRIARDAVGAAKSQSESSEREVRTVDELGRLETETFGNRKKTIGNREAARIENEKRVAREKENREKERRDREASGLGKDVERSIGKFDTLTDSQQQAIRKAAISAQEGGGASGMANVLDQVLRLLESQKGAGASDADIIRGFQRRLAKIEREQEAEKNRARQRGGRTGAN